MKKKIVFSFIFFVMLVNISYVIFEQSKNTSPDNTAVVKLENAPCKSINSAEINAIEEEIESTTEFVEAEPVEKNTKAVTSLQEVVAEYFDVENISSITISQQTEEHAQGEFGQNWWLAFNDDNGVWRIITSGCSYINCHEISGYDFPTEMAPICWDTSNNQLVNR